MLMASLLDASLTGNDVGGGQALKVQGAQRKGFTSDDILRLLVYSPMENKSFVPNGALDELITLDTVTSTLAAVGLPAGEQLCLARVIIEKGKRIFAILLFINQVSDIQSLFSEGFTDEMLPVAYHAEGDSWAVRSYPRDSENFRQGKVWVFFQQWKKSTIFSFCERQWMFLAPVFYSEQFKYVLHRDAILPFISVKGQTKHSNFSVVFRVEVHAAHLQRFRPAFDVPLDCAIKELAAPDSDNAFEKESNALACMRKIDHKHLIKCIAAVQKERRYFFIFPWADGGNLREFWASDDFAPPSTDNTSWAISQMCGLAEALTELHHYNTRHGDLKPENILRFSDSASPGHGRLVIADLGLAKVHTDMTRSRHFPTRTTTGTARYEAPEAFSPDQSRSRLYDLWAMGCIILEFLTWILHGRDELRKFNSSFESYAGAARGSASPLDQVAESWMNYLLQDPRCARNTALGEILDFIRQRLLVPIQGIGTSPSRASARELCDYLSEVSSRCVSDQTYLFDPSLWKTQGRSYVSFNRLRKEASLLAPLIKSRVHELPLQIKLKKRLSSLPQLATGTCDNSAPEDDLEKTPRKPTITRTDFSAILNPGKSSDINLPEASALPPAVAKHAEKSTQDQQAHHPDCDLDTEVDNRSIRSTTEEISSSESSWSTTTSGYGFDSTSSLSENMVGATTQDNRVLESLVRSKKADIANRTISWFSSKLDSGLTLMAYQQGESSAAGGAALGSGDHTDGPNRDSQAPKKRKGAEESNRGHDPDDGDSGEDDDRKGKGKKKPRTSTNHSRKLACPFYKLDPELQLTGIREHLFRTHTQPEGRCHRCLWVFENVAALQQHQRQPTPCGVVEQSLNEVYIDANLAHQLRRKNAKGSLPKKSESVKWKDMFHLIFPTVEPIPNPYYVDDQEKRSELEVIQDFSSFAAREMRHEMDTLLSESGIEDTLRARLVKRFQNFQPRIQEKYLHHQRQCQAGNVESETESPERNTRTPKPEECSHHGDRDSKSKEEDDTRDEGGGDSEAPLLNYQLQENEILADQPHNDGPQLPTLLANILPNKTTQPREWNFGDVDIWDIIPNFPSSTPSYHTAPASLPSTGAYHLYGNERASENIQNTGQNPWYSWPTQSSFANIYGTQDVDGTRPDSQWASTGQHNFTPRLSHPDLTPVPSSLARRSSQDTTRLQTFWQHPRSVGISEHRNQPQNQPLSNELLIGKTYEEQNPPHFNSFQENSTSGTQLPGNQSTGPRFFDSGYLTMRHQTDNSPKSGEEKTILWEGPFEGHETA
ncbi:hypothetical protein F5Y19DRAFT_466794 [Xylariaceae sp. FL1651]|nr:hypothetical protein F5Y19DRAFT_466794 [Xylariaceae sp. FL1651]